MNDKIMLELKNINKIYKGKNESLHILKNLNLKVKKGEFISILGKSGSGKSTLLNIIGLLDDYESGEIFIDNQKILEKNNSDKLDKIKNQKLGFVFQFHYLLNEFTALENVMLPALLNGEQRKNVEQRAELLLKEVGLQDRINHKPNQLSGGEKQRVAISRALINNPDILLADEPTGNLDEETSDKIHNLFKKINKEKEQTIIVVTHSKEFSNFTDKKYFMTGGKLELNL